jgi:hypothetical protein
MTARLHGRAGRVAAKRGGFPGAGSTDLPAAEPGGATAFPALRLRARPGLDEGLLSFCLPILILYRDFLLDEQIVVTNDSAPSYVQAAAGRGAAVVRPGSGGEVVCAPPCMFP